MEVVVMLYVVECQVSDAAVVFDSTAPDDDVLMALFPQAPADVREAVLELGDAMARSRPYEDWARMLRLSIREVEEGDGVLDVLDEMQEEVREARARERVARDVRDDLIRALIERGGSMYSLAKRLGISPQAVRAIRDGV